MNSPVKNLSSFPQVTLPHVRVSDIGLQNYEYTWDLQRKLHTHLVRRKREESYKSALSQGAQLEHHFLICEHPPVFTLGKSGKEDNLLLSESELTEKGITFNKINRGGDITYHGPGQIVGYPLLDLDDFFTDVHRYVRTLEEIIIRLLADLGIEAYREKDFTGVWVRFSSAPSRRKICAIGVHLSRWVTMHGFAFNVNNDLNPFDFIVPCGIQDPDRGICSLQSVLGSEQDMDMVKKKISYYFALLFEATITVDNSIPNL